MRHLSVTAVCPVTQEFCKKYDNDLGPTLTDLASELVEKYPTKSGRSVSVLQTFDLWKFSLSNAQKGNCCKHRYFSGKNIIAFYSNQQYF